MSAVSSSGPSQRANSDGLPSAAASDPFTRHSGAGAPGLPSLRDDSFARTASHVCDA